MNSLTAAIQDMGIDHRGADISVPQELRNGPDVVAIVVYGPPDVPGQATWVSVRLVAEC